MTDIRLGIPATHSQPPSAGANGSGQHLRRSRLDRSRRTILYGWTISMSGIVTCCFLISNADQKPDLACVLAASGVIFIGVGLWLAGYVKFLRDAGASAADAAD
ncbi:MAG: hypothetical protein PHY45_04010 [Rhodocyclaceae bacterium]|nr:hypothetical protein [Rhodocyclaceae bacterium]